nr:hypothetical protein [Burkholderia gladioli]
MDADRADACTCQVRHFDALACMTECFFRIIRRSNARRIVQATLRMLAPLEPLLHRPTRSMQNTTTMPVLRALLNRTRSWLKHHTRDFKRSDFWPGFALKQAAIVLAAWALPAIAGVIVTDWLGRHRSVRYLQTAIQEGMGPHIWNVFAMLGLILTGLLIAAPRQRWLATAAHQVLQNTYALGALMFGLLLGEWICVATPQHAFVLIIAMRLMLALAFSLNLAVWYVAFLVSPARLNTGFMHTIARLAPQFRLPLAAVIVAIAVNSLYVYLGK